MKFKYLKESERIIYVKPDERQVSYVQDYLDDFGEVAIHVNPTSGDIIKMVNKYKELRGQISNDTLYVWYGPVEHYDIESKKHKLYSPITTFYFLLEPELMSIYPDDIFEHEERWTITKYDEDGEEEETHLEDMGIAEFPDNFNFPGIVVAESNANGGLSMERLYKNYGKKFDAFKAVQFFVNTRTENYTIRSKDGAIDGKFDSRSNAEDWLDFIKFIYK